MYQSNFQQQSNMGSGDNSGGIGKLLISNLDFGVNEADVKVLLSVSFSLTETKIAKNEHKALVCRAKYNQTLQLETDDWQFGI